MWPPTLDEKFSLLGKLPRLPELQKIAVWAMRKLGKGESWMAQCPAGAVTLTLAKGVFHPWLPVKHSSNIYTLAVVLFCFPGGGGVLFSFFSRNGEMVSNVLLLCRCPLPQAVPAGLH